MDLGPSSEALADQTGGELAMPWAFLYFGSRMLSMQQFLPAEREVCSPAEFHFSLGRAWAVLYRSG